MAVTLEQLKESTQDKIAQGVISELQQSSFLLENLTFDDCVSAAGGSNLVYGYDRVKKHSTAEMRDLNKEFTANEAEVEKVTTQLGILGGAYKIDRVIAQATNGAPVDQVLFQLQEKIDATKRLFNNNLINGTKSNNQYDGLAMALKDSSTECTSTVDISTFDKLKANAIEFNDMFNRWIGKLIRRPDALLLNADMKATMQTIATILGRYTITTTSAGVTYDTYAGIPLVDLESADEDETPVVADGDIYAVCLGLNEFHGVTLDGNSGLSVYTPDFKSGERAVHQGSVEFVCATCLKRSKAAGVMHTKVAEAGTKPSEPTTGGTDSESQPLG